MGGGGGGGEGDYTPIEALGQTTKDLHVLTLLCAPQPQFRSGDLP